jgi:Ca2+-binding RTX toxin-like protein
MMRSVFSGRPAQASRLRRHHNPRSRRSDLRVEGLENRNLMTAGSVSQSAGLVTITPAPTGPNVAVVSYQQVNGSTMLDVNLNGTNNYFALSQVSFVYYMGSSVGGSQTFDNTTGLHTIAWAGSGENTFIGGSGQDEFIGGTGSGTNIFEAGTGYDTLIGGNGVNVFTEATGGSGVIIELGSQDTIMSPSGSGGNYQVI